MFIENDFFLESLPDGDSNKITSLRQATKKVIDERVQGEMFTKSVKKKSEFKYLNDKVRKSVTSKAIKFTNYIGNTRTEYAKMSLQKLKQDLNIVLTSDGSLKPIEINKRFRSCLSLYMDQVEGHETFMQSDIRDAAGGQIGVRVYFRLDLDEVDLMPVFVIVLIDPHHLVFPTAVRGKSKEKITQEKYSTNAGSGHCMSKYLD